MHKKQNGNSIIQTHAERAEEPRKKDDEDKQKVDPCVWFSE